MMMIVIVVFVKIGKIWIIGWGIYCCFCKKSNSKIYVIGFLIDIFYVVFVVGDLLFLYNGMLFLIKDVDND